MTLFFVTFVAYRAKLRLRDNPPLERTAAAVYFTSGHASRVTPPLRPLNAITFGVR